MLAKKRESYFQGELLFSFAASVFAADPIRSGSEPRYRAVKWRWIFHVHHHKAGIEAARLIVDLIENAAAEARHIILPVELVVRGSTRSIHADNETMSRPREIKGRHT
jgi:hypothetical protein